VSEGLCALVVVVGAVFGGGWGFIAGRWFQSRRTARRRVELGSAPAHRELRRGRSVWFPFKGEWRRGLIDYPTGGGCHYYRVIARDIGMVTVAHLDLRLVFDNEPIAEPCPPMSIVEYEREERP
jgi:hypothetical protein